MAHLITLAISSRYVYWSSSSSSLNSAAHLGALCLALLTADSPRPLLLLVFCGGARRCHGTVAQARAAPRAEGVSISRGRSLCARLRTDMARRPQAFERPAIAQQPET